MPVFRPIVLLPLSLLCCFCLLSTDFSPYKNPDDDSSPAREKQFGWLAHYVDQFNLEKGFSGAVLVAHGGHIVFEQAIGWQNVKQQLPNTKETRFNLGSGNKMFTAVAIAQLVEAGKLRFEDPLITYLPDYLNQEFARSATIGDLLQHSSGLGDYWDEEYEQHWHKELSLEDYLPFITNKPIQFDAGTDHAYSNSGFILLGLIIEQVSGTSYFDYIRKNIYQVAEMDRSDSYARNGEHDLAIPYQGLENTWYEARHGFRGSSAGGGFSTLHDMLKFDLALRNHRLLGAEYVDLICSDKTPKGQPDLWEYGYGFIVNKDNGKIRIGHGGRAPGTYFEYYFYPDNEYTLILFSNCESGSADALFRKISDFITDPEQTDIEISSEAKSRKEAFLVELVDRPENEREFQLVESHDNSHHAIHWPLISALAQSMNQGKYEAFNRNFARQDLASLASHESMFNFMVDEVIPRRGNIKEFHTLGDLVKISDSEFPIQVGTFHLEDGYPGSISISVNQEGKIDHLSLFVHPQICSHGPTQTCPKVSLPVLNK